MRLRTQIVLCDTVNATIGRSLLIKFHQFQSTEYIWFKLYLQIVCISYIFLDFILIKGDQTANPLFREMRWRFLQRANETRMILKRKLNILCWYLIDIWFISNWYLIDIWYFYIEAYCWKEKNTFGISLAQNWLRRNKDHSLLMCVYFKKTKTNPTILLFTR